MDALIASREQIHDVSFLWKTRGDYSLNSPHSDTFGICVRPAVRPGRCPGTPPSGGTCAAGTPTRRAARSSFCTPLASPAPGGASFRTPPPNPRLLALPTRCPEGVPLSTLSPGRGRSFAARAL